jgi:hypothetical protein
MPSGSGREVSWRGKLAQAVDHDDDFIREPVYYGIASHPG